MIDPTNLDARFLKLDCSNDPLTGQLDAGVHGFTTSGPITGGSLVVDTTTLVVDAANNRVGIGTATPQAALDIGGSGALRINNGAYNGEMTMNVEGDWQFRTLSGVGNDVFIFRGASPNIYFKSTGADDSMGFSFYQIGTRRALFQFSDLNNQLRFISSYGRLSFNTDNAGNENLTRMTILEDGNVGIGTVAPGAQLDVSAATGGIARLSRVDAEITIDEVIGSLEFYGTGGENVVSAKISAISDFTWGAFGIVTAPTNLVFYTTGLSDAAVSERMRIDSAGGVGIGSTAPVGLLHVGDQATNYVTFAADGELNLVGTARVKEHIEIGAASWKQGATAPTPGLSGNFPHLSFADGADEAAHYAIKVPFSRAAGEDLAVIVDWYYTGAQDNGKVLWKMTYLAAEAGEDPTAAGTTVPGLTAGTHTTGQLIRTTFPVGIISANIEAHDTLGMKLWRDGDDGTDTLAKAAILLNVHLDYIADKLDEPTV